MSNTGSVVDVKSSALVLTRGLFSRNGIRPRGSTTADGGRMLRLSLGPITLRFGGLMSSEHVTEQVPLSEIQEGDTIQDPISGQWFTVTRTADGTGSVNDLPLTRRHEGP